MNTSKKQKDGHISMPPDLDHDYFASVMVEPDQKQAEQMTRDQAGLTYDTMHAAEITQLEIAVEDIGERYQRSKQALAELERQKENTLPKIRTTQLREQKAQTIKSPFRFIIWFKDFTILLTALFLGIGVVGVGAANVYSIIMASGTPVFLEDPRLAIMLSALLPIGSVALKSFSNVLNDKPKKRYMLFLYGATAASLLAWVILFGLTFGSAASEFDWDSLDSGAGDAGKGAAFTVVQLLAEMLVGATLFQFAADIWASYAPMTTIPNPVYEELEKNIEALRPKHEQISQEFSAAKSRLNALQNGRASYVSKQVQIHRREAARIFGAPALSSKPNSRKEKNLMKPFVSLIAVMLLSVGMNAAAQAKTVMIGLSPMHTQSEINAQNKQVLRYAAQHLESGDRIEFFDAYHNAHIGTFTKPAKKSYHSVKALMRYNTALVSALRSRTPATPAQIEQSVKGAVKIPQFLSFLAENYGAFDDTAILILGSPIHVEETVDAWDMRGGKFAGDGHFSALPQESLYSVVGKENYLTQARVYILYPDRSWIMNPNYAFYVKRLWTLYVEAQNGKLAAFTDDASTFWNRVINNAGALPHSFKRDMTSKLETFEVQPELPDEEHSSIHERELTTTPPDENILRIAENVEIGLSWSCETCDLDLYVRPNHVADVLYYGHTKSPEGLYHKDFLSSPQSVKGYETVTFIRAADLRDTLIAVNWFGGTSAEGVTGEIRLAVGGKTYGLPIRFKAGRGNSANGRDAILENAAPANDNWLVIDPQKIIGLK